MKRIILHMMLLVFLMAIATAIVNARNITNTGPPVATTMAATNMSNTTANVLATAPQAAGTASLMISNMMMTPACDSGPPSALATTRTNHNGTVLTTTGTAATTPRQYIANAQNVIGANAMERRN